MKDISLYGHLTIDTILDGDQIEIGPYSVIGPKVVIGDNSK